MAKKAERKYVDYYQYIKSPEWKSVKIRYLKSDLDKSCFVCCKPFNNQFHFHHRTYKRLGSERLLDIVPVCSSCHTEVHSFQKEMGYDLWYATTKLRRVKRKERNRPDS